MGYLHIENLYRETAQAILLFRECYALEKIHGTSAHVAWKDGKVSFSSGGEKHEKFAALFNESELSERFRLLGGDDVVVFGEAYGGKCQGMSKTYGPTLKFVVFDVKIGDTWLSVPNAEDVARKLGLEFVYYDKIPTTLEAIDDCRNSPSEQAYRNGCATPEDRTTWKMREGIVLRPLVEFRDNRGNRVIAKHKRPEFAERITVPDVDPSKRELMENAEAIALEFVTDTRLQHVLDKLGNPSDISSTGDVIKAMVEDVTREASGEITDNKTVRKAIGARAAKLFKIKATTIRSNNYDPRAQ